MKGLAAVLAVLSMAQGLLIASSAFAARVSEEGANKGEGILYMEAEQKPDGSGSGGG